MPHLHTFYSHRQLIVEKQSDQSEKPALPQQQMFPKSLFSDLGRSWSIAAKPAFVSNTKFGWGGSWLTYCSVVQAVAPTCIEPAWGLRWKHWYPIYVEQSRDQLTL